MLDNEMSEDTQIGCKKPTRERLRNFSTYKGQTWDEILQDLMNKCKGPQAGPDWSQSQPAGENPSAVSAGGSQ